MTDEKKLTAEETLCGFIDAWQKREWKKLLNYVQISVLESWGDDIRQRIEYIKSQFWRTPIEVTFLSIKQLNDVVYEAHLSYDYAPARGTLAKTERHVRIICEKGYMLPDPNGTWGVVPATIFI